MDSACVLGMQNHNCFNELTDRELVVLCQAGTSSAFDELVDRHSGTAIKVALSILRDRQEAEDEVQNAMWKAYQHIAQFQQEAKFSTWLTRIVVNQCLMRLRQLRRAKFLYLDEAPVGEENLTLEVPDARQSPETDLGKEQIARVLQEEIRRTPPLLRTVFLLRDVEQRPMPEVADLLGISVAAAKSRLLRSRAELRNRLSRHYGEMGPATLIV
jgi:RNA polymerase sigma-70 factor, ECF subfamily